ncbi:MAG: tRNA epoxyqueuosine(34) reductase QueG [Flavobacteriaceae bacterium]|nr:tRNA epoxyqueuosine(34) reductase QueG [Flavobacteriaceae bacterium]
MLKSSEYSSKIKAQAKTLGFMSCGISKADFLEAEAPRLEQWLNQNHHGKMGYMANHFDKRLDPRVLVPGAKSVVSLLLNYHTDKVQTDQTAPKISTYAYGQDYHLVIKDKLKQLMTFIHQEIGEVGGRVFVDSAPVMDKAWAAKSGLGWMGKNTNLISKKAGSFFFIAELIIDLELEYDLPVADHCGSCTACIDACPTEALIAPYQIDGSKCISYLTIELKEAIPEEFQTKMEQWVFGCDVCQSVCPWNRFATPHTEPKLDPHPDLLDLTQKDWEEMTEEVFGKLFQKSAVKRAKYEGLQRNISFLSAKKSPE